MMRVTYVHNVIMPYKEPLLSRLGARDDIAVTAISSRSHWPNSKFHVHLREGRRDFDLRTVATLDVVFGYRGRQAHLFYSPTITREVARSKPDVLVLGVSNLLNNSSLVRWAVGHNIPYVWHGIGSVYSKRSRLRSMADREVRSFITSAAAGIAFNERAKEYYTTAYDADPADIHVVPNVVDTERVLRAVPPDAPGRVTPVGPAPHMWKLRFVGALQAAKRIDSLIAAASRLRRRGHAIALRIAGDGPERERLAQQLGRSSWQPDEVLVGRLDFDDAARFLAGADIAVLPGLGGLGVTHALASGTPVICARGDGSPPDQIVDGINGLVLESATPAHIAAGVERLMQNGAWRRDSWFDSAVRPHTSRLEIGHVASSFASVLRTALGAS